MVIMDQTKTKPQPQHYSTHFLFDTKTRDILDGLDLASCNTDDISEIEIKERDDSKLTIPDIEAKLVVSDVRFCNTCQIQFADREEQLLHYKSDWHRYNLHLRLRGAPTVTEEQFETMSGDVSSISGSDDDEGDEDKQNEDLRDVENDVVTSEKEFKGASSTKQRDSHKVYFRNKAGELISVHRCLLHHKKSPIYEKDVLISTTSELPKKSKWAVLMVTCGHFAGAIFNGNEILEHKTFHRYTVRKKRGTAQSSHDSKGRQASSAGANLRRYNEAALVQEVQELMNKWQDLLNTCHLVFVRIPVANRGMFYGGKNAPFKKDDSRIRVIPFATRRPTFSELKRVQQMLASVECYGKEADIGAAFPRSPRRYFDKETGQLEIGQFNGEQPIGKMKARPASAKARLENGKAPKNQAPSDIPNMTEHNEVQVNGKNESVDMDLVETIEMIDLSELKEFDCTPKRKRNKGKEKETESKIADFSLDEREIRWKNSLFTSCKTGNEKIFGTIIEEMTEHHKEAATTTENMAICVIGSEERALFENQKLAQETSSSQNCCTDDHTNSLLLTSPSNKEESDSVKHVAEFLNRPLGDGGQTLLHLASRENQDHMVNLLLEHGANPALKDKTGKLPYNLAGSEARNVYRRFMSLWPDRYDYSTAQVPSPLTEEMEAERRRKAAEKRKAKKKAANERNKEKKEAMAKQREEDKEKERFLALSDREKRALAAERRILQQHDPENSVKPVLSRCWECAMDITGKVPFEYNDYKFCSTKCLREHRSKSK